MFAMQSIWRWKCFYCFNTLIAAVNMEKILFFNLHQYISKNNNNKNNLWHEQKEATYSGDRGNVPDIIHLLSQTQVFIWCAVYTVPEKLSNSSQQFLWHTPITTWSVRYKYLYMVWLCGDKRMNLLHTPLPSLALVFSAISHPRMIFHFISM